MPNVVTVDKLIWYIEHNRNVLLTGRHGVGKTTLVRAAFEAVGLKYRIFSAATMDPWVDFIGVPKEHQDENGNSFLKLVRPRDFENDEVEALFFDEFNRSHKKIRNAVMELIQFKSINDRQFKNLRVVWAAINPADDDTHQYDVEHVDPAQFDRFHVHILLPYKPNRKYFQDKFGNEVASTAVTWWNALPQAEKDKVSPRRLDYALEMWKIGGHLEDVIPISSNVGKLRTALKTTPIMATMNKLFDEHVKAKKGNKTEVAEDIEQKTMNFLAEENTYESVINEIKHKPIMIAFFVPLMPEEKISSLLQTETLVRSYFRKRFNDYPRVREVMQQIVDSNVNISVVREFKRVLQRAKVDKVKAIHQSTKLNPNRCDPYSSCSTNANFSSIIKTLLAEVKTANGTYARKTVYEQLENHIPADMQMADALATLKFLNIVIRHSHPKVLNRWKNLTGIINNCVGNLHKAQWNFAQFYKEYPMLANWIVNCDDFYFKFER